MIRILTAALALIPALAHADAGPAGHAHPHGLEGVAVALGLAALGWLAWKALK